ncbi:MULTISPECIES: TIGR02206 family membrane protein [unclassified Nocardioides]|uniref:YwaF family protein n=1 Tax=unclassified Nocardioides TaxID=2615069 RepID=UPI00360C62B2
MSAAERFTAYDASHFGALGVLILGAVLLVVAGRALGDRDPDDRLGKGLAVVIVAAVVPLQVLYFTPTYWSLDRTLPVQLCDVASVVAAYALWTHRRWAVALTYYWGLTLTTQAIATPDLATPFPEPLFLLYWLMHLSSVWAAVHLTWGRRLRPDWRGYRIAIAGTAVWVACVVVVNVVAGTNYGYLNEKPNSASILDLLGPWPWYVLAEAAIIATGWALITWPWVATASASPETEPSRRR